VLGGKLADGQVELLHGANNEFGCCHLRIQTPLAEQHSQFMEEYTLDLQDVSI
jgi:hypothetical protein